MAPTPDRREPAGGGDGEQGNPPAELQEALEADLQDRGDRAAQSLRELAEQAERDRSDPGTEAGLLRRAAGGDPAAEEALFNENLAMVLRAAHEGAAGGPGPTEDELLQEGSLGLIEAIKGFADSGQPEFRPYAERLVRAHIAQAREEEVRAAAARAQLVADAEAYEAAEVSIRRLKGRDATLEELAEKLEWPRAKTQRLGELVAQARRAHDEELLNYVDPADLSEFGEE